MTGKTAQTGWTRGKGRVGKVLFADAKSRSPALSLSAPAGTAPEHPGRLRIPPPAAGPAEMKRCEVFSVFKHRETSSSSSRQTAVDPHSRIFMHLLKQAGKRKPTRMKGKTCRQHHLGTGYVRFACVHALSKPRLLSP